MHSLPKVDNMSFHLNIISQLAALVCTIGVHGNIGNRKQSFMAIYSQEHAWEGYLPLFQFYKKLVIFSWLLLCQEDNISDHMNLVSQLAAVIFSLAFTETSKKSGDMAESGQKLTLHEYLICYISKKRRLILSWYFPRQVDSISFHLNIVSYLAALVFEPGIRKNVYRRT